MSYIEELVQKQTQDMLERYPVEANALSWSEETLQNERNKRLKTLLIYAKSSSPWYKKSLAGIDVENITEQRLIEIPPLDKATLMENWDEIVTDPRLSLALVEAHIEKMGRYHDTLYLLDHYHALASSGSSGKRGVFVYNWEEWNRYYLYCVRYRSRGPAPRQTTTTYTRKPRLAMVAVSNTVYAMYALSKTFKFNNTDKYYFSITQPLDQIINGLNEVQPDILQGTPTTIHKLCLETHAGRLAIQPRAIIVGGESLYKPIRELMVKTWPNAYIYNAYGSSEGLVGIPCRANSKEMHLNDDGCIVQPVDKYNNLLAKGIVPHHVYLTNLYNYTLPLIRYEVSDQLLFLDKTCECGVNHQLIAEPQGRPEFDFIYPGNIFVHHLTFVTPLLHEKNIQEYQVAQTREGAEIRIVSTGFVDKNQLAAKLRTNLGELGLSQPEVTVVEVDKLEYPPSGKLKRFLKIK